jgi:aminomethyltransferase
MTPGSEALRDGAALLDLSRRGRIRVTGEDRARLLHAMSTNHVQQMKPGEGLYTFFLDAQGRILADAFLLCFADHFMLDTEAATRESLAAHLDRFIIADDVALEDITGQTFCLAVEGPRAVHVAGEAGTPIPYRRGAHVRWGDLTAAAVSATGEPGVRLYGPLGDREETVRMLEGAGALAASPEDAELARLRHFLPVYGVDITDRTLSQETQQTRAMHFQKGCYLGQEIVERVRSRGHLNRLLMGFRGQGDTAPQHAAKVLVEGKEAGEVSSAGAAQGEFFGLAWVRTPHAQPGAMAEINGSAAELFAPAD